MKFIKILKNNLSLLLRFICRSRENGNPDLTNAYLDSRLPSFAKGFGRARRGNDRRNLNNRKLSVFKNLKPKTYHLKPSFHNLPPSPRNLKPKTYNLKPNLGFTLIETLVAISILMIAVASPLTISQKGLASAIYAKDQIIASYLAQDAIEYLINLSGQNVANGSDWLDGISAPCETACAVNTRLDTGIVSCNSGTCDALNYNESTYIYNHDTIGGSNKVSPFTRSVKVIENPSNEALITITMFWKDKNTDRTLNFYTRIYNWR